MKMILRWFPDGADSIPLKYIRQVPGVSGVATCLMHIPVGETWPLEDINDLRDNIAAFGLEMEVIESINVHESIKKGIPGRDHYIENYIQSMRNLAQAGVKCLCYNVMPVMDWVRSNLAQILADGSTTMAYHHETLIQLSPNDLTNSIHGNSGGFWLPGWEEERFPQMEEDIRHYRSLSEEQYWENIAYFIEAIVPVAHECDINLAVHPDDPPWPIFGLPKIITDVQSIRRFLSLNDNNRNGITLCTGSLGASTKNDIPAMLREFVSQQRVPFVHLRNIKHTSDKDFIETAHLSNCGDLDMFEVVLALYESGFDGYIRPDHGRMIWGEQGRPGYGLYDRALGANYLLGIWEAIKKYHR